MKGRSPRSAEGEEARLCGGLWTPQGAVSNHTHSPRKYVIADPSFCGLRLLVCLAPTQSLSRTRVFYPRSDGAGKWCDEFSRADNRAGQTMALKPWPRLGCTIPWPRADAAGQWWRTADRRQPSTEHQRALKTLHHPLFFHKSRVLQHLWNWHFWAKRQITDIRVVARLYGSADKRGLYSGYIKAVITAMAE